MRDARCLFISDLHLDQTSARCMAGLVQVLARSTDYDELFILGDLVEMWVGDDDDSPFARDLVASIAAATQHTNIYLMHGNRDFLLADRFAAATGTVLLEDPALIERNGMRMLLSHGDAYCTRDAAYQQMRTLFRAKAWQQDILSKSLEERRALGRALRAQSHAANSNKAENIMDVTPTAIEAAIEHASADAMIHGHTHRPGIHNHRIGGRTVSRYVLGDWLRCGWAVRWTPSDLDLLRFALPNVR
jgi:UDP-2,3-diacylglucosamine hydrolase